GGGFGLAGRLGSSRGGDLAGGLLGSLGRGRLPGGGLRRRGLGGGLAGPGCRRLLRGRGLAGSHLLRRSLLRRRRGLLHRSHLGGLLRRRLAALVALATATAFLAGLAT